MCPGILIISEAKISWVEAKMLRIEAKIHIVDILPKRGRPLFKPFTKTVFSRVLVGKFRVSGSSLQNFGSLN